MSWWTPKVPRDEVELNTELDKMGITFGQAHDTHRTNILELQRRWLEGKRAIREHRLWIVVVLAAAASVVSAITALVAVLAG